MLSLLLDQNISPTVAEQARAKHSGIEIVSLYSWRGGAVVGAADPIILRGAAEEGLTLVTYDRKTFPPILAEWGTEGRDHAGVIFVDDRTVRSSEIGRLVRALIYYWNRESSGEWTNRAGFLPAPPQ
jgi:hypothetical protein